MKLKLAILLIVSLPTAIMAFEGPDRENPFQLKDPRQLCALSLEPSDESGPMVNIDNNGGLPMIHKQIAPILLAKGYQVSDGKGALSLRIYWSPHDLTPRDNQAELIFGLKQFPRKTRKFKASLPSADQEARRRQLRQLVEQLISCEDLHWQYIDYFGLEDNLYPDNAVM